MKRALIIVLFAAVVCEWVDRAFAGTKVVPHRAGPRLLGPQSVDPNHPTLEFAPVGGEGMTAACACTNPTGTKGEVLTFSRGSSGTCLKGSMLAGIADGDMSTCVTDKPRVMPGDDGGVQGLLVETTKANVVQRSQQFDDPYWTTTVNGVAAPGIAPNQATAPDGTLTAEWIAFPATSGVQYSLYQSANIFTGSVASSGSVFVKGKDGSSGQICVAVGSGVGSTSLRAFNGTTWTRCTIDNVTPSSLQPLYIGNYSGGNGACNGVSFPASNVYVWGAQGEVGATFSSSYIATTSATVTRASELADLAVTFGTGTTGISIAASVVQDSLSGAGNPALVFFGDRLPGVAIGSAQYISLELASASLRATMECTNPPCSSAIGGTNATASNSFRESAYFDGTNGTICMNGACDTGGRTYTAPAFTRVRIGNYNATTQVINGVVKRVCLDGSSTRCR